jgi:hypothetical protein
MLSTILRIASIVCTAVLVVSFVAFASDEAGHSSKRTVAEIASADASGTAANDRDVNAPSPSATTERMREKAHGALREHIDDVNDELTAPFAGIVSGSIWAQRIVGALLAFLVFGAGLGFLSRYAAGRGV